MAGTTEPDEPLLRTLVAGAPEEFRRLGRRSRRRRRGVGGRRGGAGRRSAALLERPQPPQPAGASAGRTATAFFDMPMNIA
jgi:hypothetical protein